MKKIKNLKIDKLYILSFLIPFSIMLIIFIIRDIYPFGDADRSFLHIDMYHQYFPFLVEFYHKLKAGDSLFYSWNTGIGSNFIALYVYYLASPFNWLCVLFPEHLLMEFQSYMVIIKIGLCGLTFTHYLKRHFNTNSASVLLFSVFYALSGYMAAYNWNVMWLDTIVLAPLVILGLELLVNEGKYKLYCITLALSIFSNYYLSIMLCIFLVLYFFVLLISREPDSQKNSLPLGFPKLNTLKNFYIKAIIRFGIYSLLAGGMAAILLLPELAALRFTEFSDINFPKTLKTYFSILDMLARHSFNVIVETGLDHWPNIYCGVAVFLLAPLYAIQKRIPLRVKAAKLLLLFFMLISYSTNMLNFIWHGLNYPDSLPARQSFLYIFLLLVICFEAFTYIKEYTNKEITNIFIGVFFFILLCEKIITDDSFSSTCFLVSGLFIIIYGIFIHCYRSTNTVAKWLVIVSVAVVIVESGVNTYLTSAPTVSRTTYLSNYDSYQTLVNRTVENEKNDFFRFEKFARRTQNDAMLIGFQGSSYFSSTLNSLVSDFYEKYGMKGSRVNYCYDGATPVTAALLANRYMLYTIDRGYDNLFELVDTEGKLYLYKNNYSLPLGYMITDNTTDIYTENSPESEILENIDNSQEETIGETFNDDLAELFSDADDKEENIHEDDSSDNNLNPIERQNLLVRKLGIDDDVFIPVEINAYGDSADLYITESAHYYAYTSNTKIGDIKMTYEDSSKTFSQIKKKYILDIGYHETDDIVSLKSSNNETLNLTVYKVNEEALDKFISKLRQQTMSIDNYDETGINGHINVTTPGQLVLSVAYEPGWTLKVDGIETDIDLFEDTFISVYLDEGEHTIELSYFPDGLIPGIIISIISLVLFAILCRIVKYHQEQNI